jgi:hypothetical protein
MRIAPFVVLALASATLAGCKKEEPPPAPKPEVPKGPNISYAELPGLTTNYPLQACVVCGKPLGGRPYVISYEGYAVAFDDKACVNGFASDPQGYVRKINPKAIFDRGVKDGPR